MAVSCGGGRRRGSEPVLLWLWCRPAAAALIRPLAWQPLYAMGVALKDKKKKEKKRKKIYLTDHSMLAGLGKSFNIVDCRRECVCTHFTATHTDLRCSYRCVLPGHPSPPLLTEGP